MPVPDHSRSVAKVLRRFRLAAASEMLCDLERGGRDDKLAEYELIELCNDYALKILLDWLSCQRGFPGYRALADAVCPGQFLDDWPALSGEYPFANCSVLEHRTSCQSGLILQSCLEPGLDLIGKMYEQIVDQPLELDGSVRLRARKDKNRRLSGQFYTPAWIVEYCFERAGNQELIKAFKAGAAQSNDGNDFPAIIDPACGTGNFLTGALDWLAAHGLSPLERLAVAKHSLHGVEIDGRAASLCRLAIVLNLSDAFKALAGQGRCLERELADLLASLKRHIIVSDAVLSGASMPGLRRFDLIATNPPYISFGSRNQPAMPVSQARYLRESFPHSTEYKIRLHSIFQDMAIRLAKEGGRLVLFLPDAFLTGRHYERLRKKLLKDLKVESLTELPENVLGGATVGRWCVASYMKTGNSGSSDYDLNVYTLVDGGKKKGNHGQERKCPDMSMPARFKQYCYSVGCMISGDRSRFRLFFSREEKDIWSQMDALPPLSLMLRGHTGIRSRHGQSSIVSRAKSNGSWKRGISTGAQVKPHCVTWDGSWINVDPDILFAGGFSACVVERPKLMVRQTADRIVAGYDAAGLYHLNNVHSFSPASGCADGCDLHFFDGLINSSLWLYLYQSKSREAGRALAQIDIEMIESMPLPSSNLATQQLISKLSNAAWHFHAGREHPAYGARADLISLIERSIDRLVYDLYDLAADQVSYLEALCGAGLRFKEALPELGKVHWLAEQVESWHQDADWVESR